MKFLLSLCFLIITVVSTGQTLRELRGAWLTTFSNIDWPKRNETPQQQKESLVQILDLLKETGMNTIYLQVRSQCDAMYNSALEPWSADLTGTQGLAPADNWDPLQFAIEESHKRGMDLHAWINPYRAVANTGALPYFSSQHIAKRRPDLLLASGTLRTLDPGIPEVRQHILAVISDIVNRYDVDGIHFDDYFYPEGAFNDNATFAKYSRGIINKNDWRRGNIDLLIEETFNAIRKIKPWVKFGVSPTGIYENSADPEKGTRTTGKQHYSELFSDTRKWLREGWVDYLEPQVYWYSRQPGSPFNEVAPWWAGQRYQRHMYIGLAGYKVGMERGWWSASEIPDQVRLLRSPASNGILGMSIYNTSSLINNKLGYRDSLKLAFKLPALVPVMPWIDSMRPQKPLAVSASATAYGTRIGWNLRDGIHEEMERPRMVAIYRFRDTTILPASSNLLAIVNSKITDHYVDEMPSATKMWYRVSVLDRLWNESEASNAFSYEGPLQGPAPVTRIPETPQPEKRLPETAKAVAAPPQTVKPMPEPIPQKRVTETVSNQPAPKTEVAKNSVPTEKRAVPSVTEKPVMAKNPSPVKITSGIRMQVLVTGSIEYELLDERMNKVTWGKIRSQSTNAYVQLPSTKNLAPGKYILKLKKEGATELFPINIIQ